MSEKQVGSAHPSGGPKKSRTPWAIYTWTAILILVIAAAQWLREFDPGFGFLITFFSTLTLVASWCVWLAFFSPLRSGYRFAPLALFVSAGLAVVASARVERFDGNMLPAAWSWRWQKQLDQGIARFEPRQDEAKSASQSGIVPEAFLPKESDFPRFLGPNGDLGLDQPVLDRDWAARPPKLLWKQRIGAGWSAFSVVGDRAVTQEQRDDQELVTCYDVNTGDGIWSNAVNTRFSSVEGGVGPRATPTIFDGRVYTVGAMGLLQCLDFVSGETLWKHDLLEEHKAVNLHWGKSNSPLIVDDKVVVSAGGPNGRSLVAYDRLSGELLWGGGDEQSSYASPALASLLGTRQILTVNEAHLASHAVDTGEKLWEVPWAGSSSANASNSQPVPIADDLVFVSKGYFQGCALFKVSKQGDGWAAENVWSKTHLKTKHTNVVTYNGYVYGLDQGVLCCAELSTGEKKWKVRQADYGHGQILRVRDLILVQSEAGDVALVEANPERFVELGRFHALDGVCWANIALTGDKLLLRNSEFAACYQLPAIETTASAEPQGALQNTP